MKEGMHSMTQTLSQWVSSVGEEGQSVKMATVQSKYSGEQLGAYISLGKVRSGKVPRWREGCRPCE